MMARGTLPEPLASRSTSEWALVRPLQPGVGLLEFEVQRGALLSNAVSVAVLPSRAATREAQLAGLALAGEAAEPRGCQAPVLTKIEAPVLVASSHHAWPCNFAVLMASGCV
jgi:hypothetical protein